MKEHVSRPVPYKLRYDWEAQFRTNLREIRHGQAVQLYGMFPSHHHGEGLSQDRVPPARGSVRNLLYLPAKRMQPCRWKKQSRIEDRGEGRRGFSFVNMLKLVGPTKYEEDRHLKRENQHIRLYRMLHLQTRSHKRGLPPLSRQLGLFHDSLWYELHVITERRRFLETNEMLRSWI